MFTSWFQQVRKLWAILILQCLRDLSQERGELCRRHGGLNAVYTGLKVAYDARSYCLTEAKMYRECFNTRTCDENAQPVKVEVLSEYSAARRSVVGT